MPGSQYIAPGRIAELRSGANNAKMILLSCAVTEMMQESVSLGCVLTEVTCCEKLLAKFGDLFGQGTFVGDLCDVLAALDGQLCETEAQAALIRLADHVRPWLWPRSPKAKGALRILSGAGRSTERSKEIVNRLTPAARWFAVHDLT